VDVTFLFSLKKSNQKKNIGCACSMKFYALSDSVVAEHYKADLERAVLGSAEELKKRARRTAKPS
jgi:hypothetical protein